MQTLCAGLFVPFARPSAQFVSHPLILARAVADEKRVERS